MKKPVKAPDRDETELRRWCIEQASRWPMAQSNYANALQQGIAHYAPIEQDLLGRAARILNWIKAS